MPKTRHPTYRLLTEYTNFCTGRGEGGEENFESAISYSEGRRGVLAGARINAMSSISCRRYPAGSRPNILVCEFYQISSMLLLFFVISAVIGLCSVFLVFANVVRWNYDHSLTLWPKKNGLEVERPSRAVFLVPGLAQEYYVLSNSVAYSADTTRVLLGCRLLT